MMRDRLKDVFEHVGSKIPTLFLEVFVKLFGNYRYGFHQCDDGKVEWLPDNFIQNQPSHYLPCLRKLIKTQLFYQFIDDRINMLNAGEGYTDVFESMKNELLIQTTDL